MLLIKNVQLFAPENLGVKDLLIAGGKIVLIDDEIEPFRQDLQIIEGARRKLLPGFIDHHVHVTGGGGEGGFRTRVPEIQLSQLVATGTTTVLGMLGTDASSRSVENLIAKTKALREEGISAYCLTGSYEYPSVSLTGSVKKDIIFIEEVLGVKVAVSDHRASHLSRDELMRLASEARVAGMLAGKPGMVVVHMGEGDKGLLPLFDVLDHSELPITTLRPTHVNRNPLLFEQAMAYAKRGGYIDLTCGIYHEKAVGDLIASAVEAGTPLERVTMSSDGYGSWSKYDSSGNLLAIGASSVSTLWDTFRSLVWEYRMPISKALPFFTSNVAASMGLSGKKGIIAEGADADLLLIDEVDEDYCINTVIANGTVM